MQDANGKESEEGGDDDYEEIQAVSRWLLPLRPPPSTSSRTSHIRMHDGTLHNI